MSDGLGALRNNSFRPRLNLRSRRRTEGSVLTVEHRVNSLLSLGFLQGHGSLPNQSTCVLCGRTCSSRYTEVMVLSLKRIGSEDLPQVEDFKYLRVLFTVNKVKSVRSTDGSLWLSQTLCRLIEVQR